MCEYYVATSVVYCECCGAKRRFLGIGKKGKRKILALKVTRIILTGRERYARYYAKNRANENEKRVQYHRENREKTREIQRKSYRRHREQKIKSVQARNRRMKSIPILCTIAI